MAAVAQAGRTLSLSPWWCDPWACRRRQAPRLSPCRATKRNDEGQKAKDRIRGDASKGESGDERQPGSPADPGQVGSAEGAGGGDGDRPGGRPRRRLTEEHKRKISLAMRGKKKARGEEARVLSAEARAKMSAKRRGRKPNLGGRHTAAAKAAISAANTGLVRSEETRAKLSAALKGRRHSLATRAKMSASHVGVKYDAATLAKKSASLRAFHARNRGGSDARRDRPKRAPRPREPPDAFVLERALLEVASLRREVMDWMALWAMDHDTKPNLGDMLEASPETHAKFMRFLALRDFVREGDR